MLTAVQLDAMFTEQLWMRCSTCHWVTGSVSGRLASRFFFHARLKITVIIQMLFQIAAFLIQFLSLPAFGIYFTLSGIGMVYQVSVIYI